MARKRNLKQYIAYEKAKLQKLESPPKKIKTVDDPAKGCMISDSYCVIDLEPSSDSVVEGSVVEVQELNEADGADLNRDIDSATNVTEIPSTTSLTELLKKQEEMQKILIESNKKMDLLLGEMQTMRAETYKKLAYLEQNRPAVETQDAQTQTKSLSSLKLNTNPERIPVNTIADFHQLDNDLVIDKDLLDELSAYSSWLIKACNWKDGLRKCLGTFLGTEIRKEINWQEPGSGKSSGNSLPEDFPNFYRLLLTAALNRNKLVIDTPHSAEKITIQRGTNGVIRNWISCQHRKVVPA